VRLRAILQPYAAPAAHTGKLIQRLKPSEAINPGCLGGFVADGRNEAGNALAGARELSIAGWLRTARRSTRANLCC